MYYVVLLLMLASGEYSFMLDQGPYFDPGECIAAANQAAVMFAGKVDVSLAGCVTLPVQGI